MNISDKELYRKRKMENAVATLNEINNLLQFEYYNNAIHRLYYASYYAVQALLSTEGVFPKSHKGNLIMLSRHFILTGIIDKKYGDFYSQLFQERQLADYAEETAYTREYVESLFAYTKEFIEEIKKRIPEN